MDNYTNNEIKGLCKAYIYLVSQYGGDMMDVPSETEAEDNIRLAIENNVLMDALLNPYNLLRARESLSEYDPNLKLTGTNYVMFIAEFVINVGHLKWELKNLAEGESLDSYLLHMFQAFLIGAGLECNKEIEEYSSDVELTILSKGVQNLTLVIENIGLDLFLSEKHITFNRLYDKIQKTTEIDSFQNILLDIWYLYTPVLDLMEREPEEKELTTHNDYEEGPKELSVAVEGRDDLKEYEIEGEPTAAEDEKESEAEETTNNEESLDRGADDEIDDFEYVGTNLVCKIDPLEYKKNCLIEVLQKAPFSYITTLAECTENSETFLDIINSIASGKYDKEKESIEGRKIRQELKFELLPHFVECVRLEGVDMDTDKAGNFDLALIDWEMRNENNRKKGKLRSIIYAQLERNEDPDLRNVLEDIENFYSEEE